MRNNFFNEKLSNLTPVA